MTCSNWSPKFHHRRFCNLGNNVSENCGDCIHLRFTVASKEEIDSINGNNNIEVKKNE